MSCQCYALWQLAHTILLVLVTFLARCYGTSLGPPGRRRCARKREKLRKANLKAMLGDLHSRLDPLVATRIYDARYSPLYRLPDELLLLILHHVSKDAVALYCVGQVSTKLRYMMIRDRSLRKHWVWEDSSDALSSEPAGGSIRSRLQADGMCDECKLWCRVAPVQGWPNKLSQMLNCAGMHYARTHRFCMFGAQAGQPYRHCSGCGLDHPWGAFEPGRARLDGECQCLGRLGAVRLCGHVTIAWSSVESAVVAWKQQGIGRRRRTGDGYYLRPGCFAVECDHPSHDIQCSNNTAGPTRPQARLRVDRANRIDLVMSWAPHSRAVSTLQHNPDGRPDAAALRAVFEILREPGQPAKTMLPASTRPGSLPEMACFGPGRCKCLRYETGTDDDDDTADARARRPPRCYARHRLQRSGGQDEEWRTSESSVQMLPHSGPKRRGIMGARCLIAAYKRVVPVYDEKTTTLSAAHGRGGGGSNGGSTTKGNKSPLQPPPHRIPPSHQWFHAMDPDTFAHPSSAILPRCKDSSCMNYYKRPGTVHCLVPPEWPLSEVCHDRRHAHGREGDSWRNKPESLFK